MVVIKVLGPDCRNCDKAEAVVREAIAGLGIEATIEHISEPSAVSKYCILMPPAVVVNDVVMCEGRVPSTYEVKVWLREALQPVAEASLHIPEHQEMDLVPEEN
ncbi:MAG: thioredoxin family protein [Anaerolineae bacterium]